MLLSSLIRRNPLISSNFICAHSKAPVLLHQPHQNLRNQRAADYEMKKSHKHWLPKWRELRRLKVIKVKLPNFHDNKRAEEMSAEEMRAFMKEKGIKPLRSWNEKTIEISSLGEIVEPYVPPEGDGKASLISTAGAKQNLELFSKKSKSYLASRKIRTFEEDFDPYNFATQEAGKIYIKMHEAMMTKDEYEIGTYVTEKALTEIMDNLKNKTLRWKFLETIEPPRAVQIRCQDLISKENMFGQVTIRFHTKQTLAIYDRFGRLLFGNELTPKDVLEYVVFEKHLSNVYGAWRVHGKIVPEWSGAGFNIDSHRTVAL